MNVVITSDYTVKLNHQESSMNSSMYKRIPLVGYTNRLSARPGESIEFKLSYQDSASASREQIEPENTLNTRDYVNTWLSQSICADPNPKGPGIKERAADEWYKPTKVAVTQQEIRIGSHGITEHPIPLCDASQVTLSARIFPTLRSESIQSVISYGALSLCIDSTGVLACNIGTMRIQCKQRLRLRHWTSVSVDLKREGTDFVVDIQWGEIDNRSGSSPGEQHNANIAAPMIDQILAESQLIVVAGMQRDTVVTHYFNGKIEAPSVIIAYTDSSLNRTLEWDFSADMSSRSVADMHSQSLPLKLVNYPTRAMTSSAWKGQEMCWRHAPKLYSAIHFHEDDVVDFEWDTTFEWSVPENMPSGVYVMRISDGVHEDAMPFYVCAPKHKPAHKLCVLAPTFTYAIYGNHARPDWEPAWQGRDSECGAYPYNPAEYPGYGQSTYNYHSDGSGICHASHRRPLLNLRPGYITFGNADCSGLRHFQADSHLFAWLDAKNIDFDVITDRELHEEGLDALSGYEHVMTTSHPEYHTAETLDALTQYRDTGGHLSYLGGNGFYWRIALHPEQTDILEIRRAEDGIRAWAAEPGEYYQAFDGQYGGLWRRNGRPPQALCGLGFSAQGQFNGSYYRKKPVGTELEWIFNGIDDDIIGNFGLSGGGAAGFELDRADVLLGTPENATVLATSENHGQDFILVPEEMLTHITTLPGVDSKELIRADIIWFDVEGGGSVFSVGSITFCGSLPHNQFENSISRLLHNVIQQVSSR
jgi:N,N-dimethylformamidase